MGFFAGQAGDYGAVGAACDALIPLLARGNRESTLPAVAKTLARFLDSASALSDAPQCAASVEVLCRSLVTVCHACPEAAPGAAATAARAMALHATSTAAMEHLCWLAGDLSADAAGMAGFLTEGGARSLVKVLESQFATLPAAHTALQELTLSPDVLFLRPSDDDASLSTPFDLPVATGAISQALVAMCGVAKTPSGGVSLVSAGGF